MADQVEINNVGGDGVASEVTLANLLKVMQSMAKAKGVNVEGVTGSVKNLNDQMRSGVTVTRKNTEALKEDTKATKRATAATNKYTKALANAASAIAGSLLESIKGLAGALVSGGEDLTSFAKHLPGAGEYIEVFTQMIDANVESFRELSRVGGTFGDGLNEIRQLATDASMPLGEFTELVSQNAETMRQFGAGTAEGARTFARMSKQFRDGPGKSLINIGFTAQELNETLLDYAEIQGRQMGAERMSGRESLQRAAEFGEQLTRLSAITGKRREQIAEEMKQNQSDARVRLAMANMSREEAARFNANLSTADQGLRDALTDMADGVANNPTAQAFQVASATFRDRAKDIENMSPEEFNNFMVQVREESEAYQRSLGAGAEAVMGANQGMADVFNFAARDAERRRLTEEDITRMEEERAKQMARDDSILNFQTAIRDLRAAFMDAFINSGLLTSLQEAFGELATALGDPKRMGEFKNWLGEISAAFKDFTILIKNFDLSTALFGGTADKTVTDADGNVLYEKGDEIEGLIGNLFGDNGPFSRALESIGDKIGDAFWSLLTSSTVLQGAAFAVGGLFAAKAVTSALSSAVSGLFTGGGGGGGRGGMMKTGGRGGGGAGFARTAGNAGKGIGAFIGNVSGGALSGAAKGIAAFANPAVPLGAAAIGAAIVAIGAGVAGAAWIMGNALPTFAEGMKSFEDIDGGKLVDAGKGMAAVSAGMAAFGAGSAVAGLGNLVGSVADGVASLFGGEDPMEKLQRFASYNIDADKVENNARAMVAFSGAMAAQGAAGAAGGVGATVGAIGGAIASFFGGETGIPYDDIVAFQGYNIDAERVRANASALVAFNEAISSAAGSQAVSGVGSMVGAIGNFVSGLFGGDSPIEQVKEFGEMEINATGVRSNALAMAAMSQALAGMSGMDLSSVEIPRELVNRLRTLGQIEGGGLQPVADGLNSIANVQGLQSNLDILNAGLDTDGISSYNEAMENLVETLNALNEELAKDNNGWSMGTGTNAGDVLGQINTSSAGSAEGMNQLNRLMGQVLAVLTEMADDNTKIERNTRGIAGNNIATGYVSATG